MGSNVHFDYKGEPPFLPIPVDLGCGNSHTLPRYVDGYEFFRLVHESECDSFSTCPCTNKDNHDYFCSYDTSYRPLNLVDLRERAKSLQPVWQEVVDYLEAEPKAYITYD